MTTLTAELRQEIEKAGDEPVRIEDPETHTTYVLLRAEVYDQLKPPPRPERPAGLSSSRRHPPIQGSVPARSP